ncbi:hypothetical protein N4P33_27245 [Streptomyces sp. 15-116A]|uniref:hypothetical protein n=1 Tax=Streptomyces sp. 15-116A TaxID=2259035 RepID=UPI0021B163E4|nr:hypothetical protein [Streptomyces sp. 15-116A]MCT7355821.1 hypothetical protein [Streptomyces sp. 15-116A]
MNGIAAGGSRRARLLRALVLLLALLLPGAHLQTAPADPADAISVGWAGGADATVEHDLQDTAPRPAARATTRHPVTALRPTPPPVAAHPHRALSPVLLPAAAHLVRPPDVLRSVVLRC